MKNLQFRVSLFAMGLCALLFAACNEEAPLGGGEEVPYSDTVSISPVDSLFFTGVSGADTVIVRCNGTWDIYGYAYWASVSPQSGKDGDTLVVSVDANTTGDKRKVSYYLYSGEAKCELFVSQSKRRELSVSPSQKLYFGYEGGGDTLTIHSEGPWWIDRQSEWLSVSSAEGDDGDMLIVSATENNSTQGREDTLVLRNEEMEVLVTALQNSHPSPIIEQITYRYDSVGYTPENWLFMVNERVEIVFQSARLKRLIIHEAPLNDVDFMGWSYEVFPECIGDDTYRVVLDDGAYYWEDKLRMSMYNDLGKSEDSEIIYPKDYIEDPAVKALVDKELELLGYVP